MKLILVRHGETEDNLKKITQGWLPGKLSPLGILQAKKVGERLKEEKIDFIYSSDLRRCIDTAKEIAKYHDVEIILDERLREVHKGSHAGRPQEINDKEADKTSEGWYKYKHPYGESFEDTLARVKDFIEEISEKHIGKTILLVSHGGALSCMGQYFEDKPFGDGRIFKHGNTGTSYLELDGENWKTLKLNCLNHLDEALGVER